MLQVQANNIRSRLRLTASALVIAAVATVTAAGAGDVAVTSGGVYDMYNSTGTNFVVGSGITADLYPNYGPFAAGDAQLVWPWPILWNGTPASQWNSLCLYDGGNCWTSASITVASGGTLKIDNDWGWMELQDMIDSSGTVEFIKGNGTGILGTNHFRGDVILDAGTSVNWGEAWIYSSNYFGTATNFVMGANTAMTFNEPHTVVNVINTISSADNTAAITFNNGAMTVNGQNTALSAYYGVVNVHAGASFTVGDASHSTAVFGDPTGSTAVINISQSTGLLGMLSGYGSIYGNVNNGGMVEPGGTGGTAGTLRIHGNYTQASNGVLLADVSPDGVSNVVVSGNATLDGSLILKVEDGDYGAAGLYNVLTASTVTGTFSNISVQGSAAFVGAIHTSSGYQAAVQRASSAQTFGHLVLSNRYNITEFNRSLYDQIELFSSNDKGVYAWLAPLGSLENIERGGVGYENTSYGVTGGVERRLPWHNAVIGVAASYLAGSMDVKGEDTTADSNTFNAALYGGADLLYARVDGTVFFNGYDATIKRDVGSFGTAESSPEGWAWGASFQISRSLFNDRVTPYLRGILARVHQNDASETGAGVFALQYDPMNVNTVVGDVGLRLHMIKPTQALNTNLDVVLAVEHDFSDKGVMVNGSFATISGSSVSYIWKGDAENALLAGVDFSDQISDHLDLFARLNTRFSIYKTAGDLSVGARYRF